MSENKIIWDENSTMDRNPIQDRNPIIDRMGRKIDYMRISITDRCNLRCCYCMPKEGISFMAHKEVLSFEEIEKICRCASALGIRKLKITGGEPLIRKDITVLVGKLSQIEGIEEITLTTNGCLLSSMAESLKEAGIVSVNISLDTLKKERFKAITGKDSLSQVLEGIEAALCCGLRVKLNCAVIQGKNVDEILDFVLFAREKKIVVRFIEMMPIGLGKEIGCMDNGKVLDLIKQEYKGLKQIKETLGNGPAIYYGFSDSKGMVGFISGVHQKFCEKCNRIRLTSDGFLKLCLAGKEGIDLKILLQKGISEKDLMVQMEQAIKKKPLSHHFEEIAARKEELTAGGQEEDGYTTTKAYTEENKMMSQIGG